MTQPPGHYGQPAGGYGDPYGQQYGQPAGHEAGYGDPYAQPSGPPGGYADPGYGQPSGPPAGYPNPGYGQPGAPAGYPDPYAQPGGYGTPPPGGGYGGPGHPHGMPAPGFPPPTGQKRRTGLVLGIVAGALALLLCGGGAIFYYMGGGGSTTGVVEGFLTALFQDRDIDAAKKYVCAKELNGFEGEYQSNEIANLSVTWDNLKEKVNNGSEAEVSADMTVKASAGGQTATVTGTWVFELTDESGWKVCDIDTGKTIGT